MKRLIDCVRLVIPVSGLVFAFLLVMPFNARFVTVTETDVKAYSVAFVSAGLATIFLVAVGVQPVVKLARGGGSAASAGTTRRLAQVALVGLALLAVSFLAVVFLVSDQIYHNAPLVTVAVASFLAAIVGTWWFLPTRSHTDAATPDHSTL